MINEDVRAGMIIDTCTKISIQIDTTVVNPVFIVCELEKIHSVFVPRYIPMTINLCIFNIIIDFPAKDIEFTNNTINTIVSCLTEINEYTKANL